MSEGREFWNRVGTEDPYFGVVTLEEFRGHELSAEARKRFFELGRRHLEDLWPKLEALKGGAFKPSKSVDYGCGVGRVLVHLAERSGSTIGVDISDAMLSECRRNLDEAGAGNVGLVSAEDFLAQEFSGFDFVHSFIVLQHVRPTLGMRIIEKLVEGLVPGGLGAIHVTFRHSGGVLQRLRFRLYRDFPFVLDALNRFLGREATLLPMFEYDRGAVLSLLSSHGCEIGDEIETDHGFRGATFIFKKAL